MGWLDDLIGNVKTVATGEPSRVVQGHPSALRATTTSSTGAQYPVGKQQAPATSVYTPSSALLSSAGQFANQVKYGMNTEAARNYEAIKSDPASAGMSEAQMVQQARDMYKDANMAPVTDPKSSMYQGPSGVSSSSGSSGSSGLYSTANAAMPNNATGSQDAGIFKPVTFRSGTGTATLTPEGMTTSLAEPYAGISDMVGEGQGLLGQAAGLAQEEPNRFDYAFDPEASAERLFGQRSDLLQPSFTQRDIALREDQFGQGRLGLLRSADAVGAGTVGGMVNPEQYAESLAQNRALAELAAASQSDAFNQEMQQAGLSQNIYQLNQAAEQQQLANLQGLGQGMFTSGLQAPALEAQLTGIPLQTEALRQNYELGLDSADIQRRLAESQISAANYQPSGWLTGLTSLGSSFLGTPTGSNWLTKLFT